MATNLVTFTPAWHRNVDNISSVEMGDVSSGVLSELRVVLNARSTKDAAIALAAGARLNVGYYKAFTAGETVQIYIPNNYNSVHAIWRADLLFIGTVETYLSGDTDANIGRPVTDPTTAEKARRCMVTLKWPYLNVLRRLSLGVAT